MNPRFVVAQGLGHATQGRRRADAVDKGIDFATCLPPYLVRHCVIGDKLIGIVKLIGFRSSAVFYERASRYAGDTKYPLKKMVAFALEGITSFSAVPLKLITLTGLVVFVITFLMSVGGVYPV